MLALVAVDFMLSGKSDKNARSAPPFVLGIGAEQRRSWVRINN
jgi:hypothetical protein